MMIYNGDDIFNGDDNGSSDVVVVSDDNNNNDDNIRKHQYGWSYSVDKTNRSCFLNEIYAYK